MIFYVSCFDKRYFSDRALGGGGVTRGALKSIYASSKHATEKFEKPDNNATHKAFPRHNKLCSSENSKKQVDSR